MRLMGLQAIYRAPRTSEPHPEHRVYPYLLKGWAIERANHVGCADITLHPCAARLSLLGGDPGLGEPVCAGLAFVEHPGRRLLRRGARGGADPATASRRSSIPIRAASSPASPSPGACGRSVSRSRWTAGAGAWTTSSSSGCGAPSNTRLSICTTLPTASRPRRVIGEWIDFYNRQRAHPSFGYQAPWSRLTSAE